jgi:predicted DNA-binding transcriptional regulator AlpA
MPSETQMLPALMAIPAAAAYCGVTPSAFRRWYRARIVPAAVRIGRRCLWRRADLDGWIANGCRPVEPATAERYRRRQATELGALRAGSPT